MLDNIKKRLTIKNMKKLILFFLFFLFYNSEARDPHDNDLNGKNLLCVNKSINIDDWGIKFQKNKKVKLFSLNKTIYEIYQFKRKYRTDIRNIYILDDKDIEYIINRSRLVFGNKSCKIVFGDPIVLFQQRINELKKKQQQNNKI